MRYDVPAHVDGPNCGVLAADVGTEALDNIVSEAAPMGHRRSYSFALLVASIQPLLVAAEWSPESLSYGLTFGLVVKGASLTSPCDSAFAS